mgnify:CR=1 FL=1
MGRKQITLDMKIKEVEILMQKAEQPFEKGFYTGKLEAYRELLVEVLRHDLNEFKKEGKNNG